LLGEVQHLLLDALQALVLVERSRLPKALRRVLVRATRGVEDRVEPFLRLGEALILGEANRNHERNVKEELPVVDRVGAAEGEVDVFHGSVRWVCGDVVVLGLVEVEDVRAQHL
jgi:hypothetical protein